MARAGDGQPRSNRRRATATVSLRLPPEAKTALSLQAKAEGYPALAPWIRDRLRGPAGSTVKRDILLAGKIGQIGGVLGNLAESQPEDIRPLLHALNDALAHVQKILLGGGGTP